MYSPPTFSLQFLVLDSVHSKSVELSTIHEDSMLGTTARKQGKKGKQLLDV